MIRHLFLIVLLGLFSVSDVSAQDGLALMKVEPGARPAGMGGAFGAIGGTAEAAPYNPAGTFGVGSFAASFGHVAYWENIRLETGYFSFSAGPKLAIHGGVRYAAIGDLERRTVIPTEDPLEVFDAHDALFKIGGAYRVHDRITAGAAFGWFFEKIDAWSGWAFNVDLGVQAVANEHFTLGASVTGIGSDLTLSQSTRNSSRPIALPTTYRVGAAWGYQRLLAAADLVYLDDDVHGHFGAEYYLHELFQLRTGYMVGYDTKNFSAGASFIQRNMTVDYAFVPYTRDLGTTHMINFTFTL
jgi:hypothetical protein